MPRKFRNNEEDILRLLQRDIPLEQRPFRRLARQAGVEEADVIARARSALKEKKMRKFGAVLRHQKAGFTENALIVWSVPAQRVSEAGKILASFREVTHCYERTPPFEGRYNLFTMVHFAGRSQADLLGDLKAAAGISDCRVLTSLEEYKKSSMEYF